MSKLRVALLLIFVLALVVTPAANAQAQRPYYYCSATRTSGGSGTYYDPWACSTDAQYNNVLQTICRYGGGTLYRIYTGYYIIIYIAYGAQQCQVTVGQQYPGYPPNTGVNLPAPLIYGAVAAAGILLVAVGLMIRRKRQAI